MGYALKPPFPLEIIDIGAIWAYIIFMRAFCCEYANGTKHNSKRFIKTIVASCVVFVPTAPRVLCPDPLFNIIKVVGQSSFVDSGLELTVEGQKMRVM